MNPYAMMFQQLRDRYRLPPQGYNENDLDEIIKRRRAGVLSSLEPMRFMEPQGGEPQKSSLVGDIMGSIGGIGGLGTGIIPGIIGAIAKHYAK